MADCHRGHVQHLHRSAGHHRGQCLFASHCRQPFGQYRYVDTHIPSRSERDYFADDGMAGHHVRTQTPAHVIGNRLHHSVFISVDWRRRYLFLSSSESFKEHAAEVCSLCHRPFCWNRFLRTRERGHSIGTADYRWLGETFMSQGSAATYSGHAGWPAWCTAPTAPATERSPAKRLFRRDVLLLQTGGF